MNDEEKTKAQLMDELAELRQRVTELKAEGERFQDLYEEAPIAYFSVGIDQRTKRINRHAAELLRYGIDDLIGRPVFDLYADTPAGKERAQQVFRRFRAGEEIREEELEMCRSDGGSVWINLSVRPIRDAGGQVVASRSIVEDITERKQAEEALAQNRRWLEVTLSSIGDAVIATDTSETITYMNPAAESLTTWTAQEALGRGIGEVFRLVNEQTRQPVENPVGRVLREGIVVGLANHSLLITRDGRQIPVADSGAPIRDAGGTVFGAVLVFHDIIERKQMEQELVRLERLRALSEMSAGVSHNLNNILTSALGPAQMLLRDSDDPNVIAEAERIVAATRRARDLVHQQVLSTRGVAEGDLQPVQVNRIVQEAVQTARPRWKDEPEVKGLVVEVTTDLEDVPRAGSTGSGLHDIFINLILNAVDAMPRGGTIAIRTRRDEGGVRITVGDTGTGMDEESRKRVFEPFFTTKVDVGSGLGLSTAYNAVTQWGGRMDVETALGEGTTFSIWLPAWTGTEAEEKEEGIAARQVRRGKLLIVEDDRDVCGLLSRLLGEHHEVAVDVDGQEALEGFLPGQYDVALIDIGIPGMPGDRVAREMRRQDASLATVLITGWELREDDPRRFLFDFKVQKPFDDIGELEDVVAQAVELHDERVVDRGSWFADYRGGQQIANQVFQGADRHATVLPDAPGHKRFWQCNSQHARSAVLYILP